VVNCVCAKDKLQGLGCLVRFGRGIGDARPITFKFFAFEACVVFRF